MLRPLAVAAVTLAITQAAAAETRSPVANLHAAWQSCLRDAFSLKASLSSPSLAADAALRECRPSETAYLDTLSLSPLLDEEDVAKARPALVARARLWLIGTHNRQL